MATVQIAADIKKADGYLQQFNDLRMNRVDYDRKWQMVSDYIRPRRDFSVTQRPNQLRPHRVVSSAATNASNRMMALTLSYLIDTTRPFVMPSVKAGLVTAGRDTELDDASLDYLSKLEWSVFDRMMLPKAQLLARMGSMLKEFCDFGCGVIWTGRRRGFGPYYKGRSLHASWWSENEEGEIDVFYYKLTMPVWRVIQRWPAAARLWQDGDKRPQEQNLTSIILACRPRPGGRAGAVVEAKPFEFVTIAEEKKAILEISGYDSFPYSVFRYDPAPEQAYAEGPGCQVLPDVMVLNHLVEAIENAASQKAVPPLAIPARMFGRVLDRRPGALNVYNAAGIGLSRADQAIVKLDFTGDVSGARELRRDLIDDIEIGYFSDWLRPRETGDMTATEVNDKRDVRLRGMSSIVAHCGVPMSILGDRSMDVMAEEGMIGPAPRQIAGANADWEYAGPLAIQQLARNAQLMLQLLNTRALAAQQDPVAAEAVDVEESLRVVAESLGAPSRVMTSRQKVAAIRQADQQRQQQKDDAEHMALAAQAARDGGQGVAALAGAAGGGQTGGGGAPFAPASPFSQPLAA